MENSAGLKEAVDTGKLVLVDFWAAWCAPCRMMNPVIEKLKNDYEGKAVIVKVDADSEPELTEQYGVQALPSFVLLRNGKEVHRTVGATSEAKLKEVVDTYL